jgi:hypothetical protein
VWSCPAHSITEALTTVNRGKSATLIAGFMTTVAGKRPALHHELLLEGVEPPARAADVGWHPSADVGWHPSADVGWRPT